MDMHPSGNQTMSERLHVPGQHQVAFVGHHLLFPPLGKGVGGGSDDLHPEFPGGLHDGPAKVPQIFTEGGDGGVGPGAHLDLGSQQFVCDPFAQQLLAFGEHGRIGIRNQIPGLGIDQHVFLFDPHRERWSLQHRKSPSWAGNAYRGYLLSSSLAQRICFRTGNCHPSTPGPAGDGTAGPGVFQGPLRLPVVQNPKVPPAG